MARFPFTIEVKDTAGNAIYGASVAITARSGGGTSVLYAGETGPTTVTNPLVTDSQGRVASWIDRGAYTATVSGSGITTYAVPFDASPGANRAIDALWLPAGSDIPLVTALPTTSLIDGMEVVLVADATNGVYWRMKYNASMAGSYKWMFIGGPPIYAEGGNRTTLTDETFASTAYVAPTTATQFTVPSAGDYLIHQTFEGSVDTATTLAFASYSVGATAAIDTDGIELYMATGGNFRSVHARVTKKTITAANTVVAFRWKVAAGTARSYNRSLSAIPVRLA
jgi:hypothetical protein